MRQAITTPVPSRDDYLRDLKDYVQLVSTGHNKSLFVIGEGGMGKTHVVLSTLREHNQPYNHFTTFSTPMELYSYLYIHRNELVVLDDMEGILENKKSVAILKSCLWGFDDRCEVQYLSSTALLMVPPRFEFTGRTIFLLNQFPKNEFVRSLVTRSVYYELKMPFAQKLVLMEDIAKMDYGDLTLPQRMEVFHFIRENANEATKELNFRTLIKAFNMRSYSRDRWRQLVKVMLQPDEDLATLRTIQETLGELTVLQQARMFTLQTGLSRSSYFRYKRKLLTR